MIKVKQCTLFFFLVLLPVVVYGQSFKNFAAGVVELINKFVYIVTAFAFIFFLFGLVRFITTAGDDQSREQGKQLMIWGTISLFVMVAIWGLIEILKNTFFT